MDNNTISAALEEIAVLLELKGENPFKARAYSTAARTVRSLEEEVETLAKAQRLKGIPGIGDSIREKITELVTAGKLQYLEDLRSTFPKGLMAMLEVEGLGPKKVKHLWDELKIQTVEDLKKACTEGRIATLKGFGEKTQTKILESIEKLSKTRGRFLLVDAREQALALVEKLRELPEATRVELAGSTRRGRETVKDVDILVASEKPQAIMDAAAKLAQEVIAHGPTKTSVRLENGLQVDVRVVKPIEFGAAWAYFTGSKEFNIVLRSRALDRGYSLNEYAMTPIAQGDAICCPTEEAVFDALGLQWVPPEMRENAGEIQLAAEKKLPRLIERADLRGVLHVHTNQSDGADTLENMVKAAIERGFEFVGISDHTKAAFYANGLDEDRVAQQAEAIQKLRDKLGKKIRIFHGVEADILPDGGVDLDQKTLEKLDFVIASIHSHFTMERDKMTKRVVSALEHPCVTVFGHPTARQLLGRDGAQFDWEAIFDAAKKHRVAIEINGQPARLDCDWVHIRRARALGLKLIVNPDAHGVDEYVYADYATTEARRGWATKEDVVNTLPAERFAKEFLEVG
ncbi:MAG TPA: DNA polymerase/3'-5' exonuclease PolX [Planctomycetota bacterium]|nr:DNA polymerase/3'-5' exonuclease PolX [Planctomycetota bacterium]